MLSWPLRYCYDMSEESDMQFFVVHGLVSLTFVSRMAEVLKHVDATLARKAPTRQVMACFPSKTPGRHSMTMWIQTGSPNMLKDLVFQLNSCAAGLYGYCCGRGCRTKVCGDWKN